AAPLAAKAAAGVLADEHDLLRHDAAPARNGGHRLGHALRRAVNKEPAVLPVGHRRPRFHRVVAGGLNDEGLVQDERGGLESSLEIAVGPLLRRLADWQTSFIGFPELLLRPLDRLQ